MGYYTDFSLRIVEGDDYKTNYEEEIGEASNYGSATFNDSIKWYDHEIDMKAYSKLHPKVLFALEGIGEENEDMWVKYFKNGKMQKVAAKITYEDYDEFKLE